MADDLADFKPQLLVYAGARLSAKDELIAEVYPLKEDGALGERMLFGNYREWKKRAVGVVYSGATFNGLGSIRGYDKLTFERRWGNSQDLIEWKARERSAEADVASIRYENDQRKMDELEEVLKPLRQLYTGMHKRFDRGGMEALERAVMRALRTPIRKSET